MLSLNKVLETTAALCTFIILFLTVLIFFSRKNNLNLEKQTTPSSNKTNEIHTPFKKLGKLRALTSPENEDTPSTIIVLNIWIPYYKDDAAFNEELSRKTPEIKSQIINYFSNFTKKQLLEFGEEKVKSDLLKEINSKLILNKINAIYFSDYIFLD